MRELTAESDTVLMSAVSEGDTAALKVLYERHSPWIRVRLLRRCNDSEVVAEVVQDTFVAVWRGAARFRGEGAVAGWIWGIAAKRLISHLRRQRVTAEVLVAEADYRFESSAEERVLMSVEYGDLGRALGALSPELRAVVQATVLDGLSTREAAQLLSIPRGTVKTRLHRAKRLLRAELVEGLS
jgi:RNA polymerase sigma-70 factor (ECF subfamily)